MNAKDVPRVFSQQFWCSMHHNFSLLGIPWGEIINFTQTVSQRIIPAFIDQAKQDLDVHAYPMPIHLFDIPPPPPQWCYSGISYVHDILLYFGICMGPNFLHFLLFGSVYVECSQSHPNPYNYTGGGGGIKATQT